MSEPVVAGLLTDELEDRMDVDSDSRGSAQSSAVGFRLKPNTNLFALVIGIDNYKDISIPRLTAANKDVDKVYRFLTKTLAVDRSHIQVLLDRNATRSAIIKGLEDLKSNPLIRRGDPILIYYAGHGCEAKAPKEWHAGNEKIQGILPYNFVFQSGSRKSDERPILDRTFGRHLAELAGLKGNNITVILDCCHSGGATRDTSVLNRGIVLPDDYDILPGVDEDVAYEDVAYEDVGDGIRGPVVAPKYSLHGMSSHVLLAACKETQYAKEKRGQGGVFTAALIHFLRGPDSSNVAYSDIPKQLPDLGRQDPQCDGKHTSRILFDANDPERTSVRYAVFVTTRHKKPLVLVGAGQIHGITPGAEFDVFATKELDSPVVCRLVAKETHAFAAETEFHPASVNQEIPRGAWAVQTKPGGRAALLFVVSVPPSLLPNLKRELKADSTPVKCSIFFVMPGKNSQLKLEIVDDHVYFHISDDEYVRDLGRTKLDLSAPANDAKAVYAIVQTAAHFFFHLRLSNVEPTHDTKAIFAILQSAARFFFPIRRSNSTKPIASKATLEAYKITVTNDPVRDVSVIAPSSANLVEGGKVHVEVVDIDAVPPEFRDIAGVTDLPCYGFKVKSKFKQDLYVWAFLFDISTLKIELLHKPSLAKTSVQPCIRAGGSLEICYGASKSGPYEFHLDGGRSDLTYLKVFLSSSVVDLSDIADPPRAPRPFVTTPPSVWDTVSLPILQKAKAD